MERQDETGDNAKNTEQRKGNRFFSRIKIHFCIKGSKDKQWMTTRTKDIGSTGLSFTHRDYLPLSTELEIKISLARLKQEIKMSGKVVRMEDLGMGGYLYGVRYDSIDSDVQEIIRQKIELMDLNMLLKLVSEKGASDLHLCVDTPPMLRIGGKLNKIDMDPLRREDLEDMLYNALTEEQMDRLINNLELDSSYQLGKNDRFRFNVHFQRGHMEATFRRIYTAHMSIKKLGLPEIIAKFALLNAGLVVITGRTNNGKTTTANAMIDLINDSKNSVIITVEDPIEHIHANKKSVIKQREVGLDTKSFAMAAREALRQDIDVIFIGEILDPDTLLVALRAAEVGHLVIVTFPAQDSAQAVERMIFTVPPYLQYQVRMQLSSTLLGIVSQKLFPSLQDPYKLVVATEILVNTPAVSNAVREANISAIRTGIQTGAAVGMHTMRSSVEKLYANRLVSQEALKGLDIEEKGHVR